MAVAPAAQTTAMELKVDLGPMPADDRNGGIIGGLRLLLDKSELCDIILIAGGQSFLAHRAVLAAVSSSFHECLTHLGAHEVAGGGADTQSLVMKLEDITHPEAVQAMLDCIYGPCPGNTYEYNPSSEDANRDVIRLSQRFQITPLTDVASRWLTKSLSTANVLNRLVTCEEFRLHDVREKILGQLTANPDALFVLAKDPEITKVPAVLQDLLVRILKLLGCESNKNAAAADLPNSSQSVAAPKEKSQQGISNKRKAPGAAGTAGA